MMEKDDDWAIRMVQLGREAELGSATAVERGVGGSRMDRVKGMLEEGMGMTKLKAFRERQEDVFTILGDLFGQIWKLGVGGPNKGAACWWGLCQACYTICVISTILIKSVVDYLVFFMPSIRALPCSHR
ncbi:hypothetical protein CPC08DRAFT_347887 [Agrocybe pediades]|nr:hypothetical protein CPC08DRAFT_347887 [Agrocybe pediades]